MARLASALLAAAVVAGCKNQPTAHPIVPPDWSGGSIEGIAPLMTPTAVQAALDRGHYGQVKCLPDRPLIVDPLNHGSDLACFRAPDRLMTVRLYFLELHAGRRLAVAFFSEPDTSAVSDARRAEHSRAFAKTLLARFGKPMTTRRDAESQSYYWRRPGGGPELPDMIDTTVGALDGANVTLTSMWAYGQQRSMK